MIGKLIEYYKFRYKFTKAIISGDDRAIDAINATILDLEEYLLVMKELKKHALYYRRKQ